MVRIVPRPARRPQPLRGQGLVPLSMSHLPCHQSLHGNPDGPFESAGSMHRLPHAEAHRQRRRARRLDRSLHSSPSPSGSAWRSQRGARTVRRGPSVAARSGSGLRDGGGGAQDGRRSNTRRQPIGKAAKDAPTDVDVLLYLAEIYRNDDKNEWLVLFMSGQSRSTPAR